MIGIEDYVSVETARVLHEKGYSGMITAATLYEVQKWLREKHNIHVCVDCNVFGWYTTLFNAVSGDPISQINGCKEHYEEALGAGIEEALKLI